MLGQVSQNRNKQRTQINVFFLTAATETRDQGSKAKK